VIRRNPNASFGRIFDPLALGESAVQPGDLGDMRSRQLLALLAEALAHLLPQLAGVDELHQAAPFSGLAVGHHPEVDGDAGVVEELVRQRDDRVQPAVLDDPAADLRLARRPRR